MTSHECGATLKFIDVLSRNTYVAKFEEKIFKTIVNGTITME